MVGHLLNIDKNLATQVGNNLGLSNLPKPPAPAKSINSSLKPSKFLSIINNGPNNFAGRKIGVLLTNGADAKMFKHLQNISKKAKVNLEVIARKIGGVKLNSGMHVKADHIIQGGPSVFFDAVVLLIAEKEVDTLIKIPSARDFIADAYTHLKFIAYAEEAKPLLQKAGIAGQLDEGCVLIKNTNSFTTFLNKCNKLRFWTRANTLIS
jgi:catalase